MQIVIVTVHLESTWEIHIFFLTEEETEDATEQQQNDDPLYELVEAVSKLSWIHYMHCVVQTQQLAIRNSLYTAQAADVIHKMRELVYCKNTQNWLHERFSWMGVIID